MHVREGDLIFFAGSRPLARLIRIVTFLIGGTARYNHVVVVVWNGPGGPIVHDCVNTIRVHPLSDYMEEIRSGRLRADVWRPTEGEMRHNHAVEALLSTYPEGTEYDVGRLLLGMFPSLGRAICSTSAGYYLEQRFARRTPYVNWKRREQGERQDGNFLTVDALTRLREPKSKGGTPWLRYVGRL